MSNVLSQRQIETKTVSPTRPSAMDSILTFTNQRNNWQTTRQIQSEYIERVVRNTFQLSHSLTHLLTRTLTLTLTLTLSLSLSRFLWPFDSRRDTLVVTLPAKGALALCCTAIEVCDSHSYIADIAHFSPTIHNLHSSLLCISLGSLSLICLVITSGTDLLLLAFRGLKTKENRGH
jgi:hypothetical protein